MTRRRFILALCCLAAGAALSPVRAEPGAEIVRTLAPTGPLRVGLYRGSPTSIVEGATPADAKGVAYDLGRALARDLGVAFQPVVFPANESLLAAAAAGAVDVVFTNRTLERERSLDFSRTFMDVEKSFLVPAGSPLHGLADFARQGLHVGVSAGSSTASELTEIYPGLVTEPVATLDRARSMLRAHELDAFATNDAILFQMSDGLPGSTVVPGHWGMEHFGAAIPKGRQSAMAYLDGFIARAGTDGTLAAAIGRAGLRGTLPVD